MGNMNIRKIRGLYKKRAVMDNNILNDFYELGRMDLLTKVSSKVYIPESIISNETPDDIRTVLQQVEYETAALHTEEGYALMYQLLTEWTGLSEYDAELIAIARQDMILCTSNEKRIMNACESCGIEYTGTLGILCCAYEWKIIDQSELKHLVDKLFSEECNCHLHPRLKQQIYEQYRMEGV
jgi:predicted nucleic acid-binding protein